MASNAITEITEAVTDFFPPWAPKSLRLQMTATMKLKDA